MKGKHQVLPETVWCWVVTCQRESCLEISGCYIEGDAHWSGIQCDICLGKFGSREGSFFYFLDNFFDFSWRRRGWGRDIGHRGFPDQPLFFSGIFRKRQKSKREREKRRAKRKLFLLIPATFSDSKPGSRLFSMARLIPIVLQALRWMLLREVPDP